MKIIMILKLNLKEILEKSSIFYIYIVYLRKIRIGVDRYDN